MQPSTNKQSPRLIQNTFKAFMLVAWVVVLGLAIVNRTAIQDWFLLRNYEAPAVISRLADVNTMTDYSRKLFYINKPVISSKSTFNKDCPDNGGEQTIVLGCYHGGQQGIYLLGVDDPRLSGVVEVTAAHEMLHSAYERLSTDERARVDRLLEEYYRNQLDDERIKGVIDTYKKTEPNDVVNEMHSIFATEIATLPPALEEYFKQYFKDRQAVVKFAAQYQQEFTSRQNAITAYDKQLDSLKVRIESTEKTLDQQQAQIESQQAQLFALRDSNIPAYNAAVPGYNRIVDDYNAGIVTVRVLITQYNDIVAKRNALAVEQDELYKELDSTPEPITN